LGVPADHGDMGGRLGVEGQQAVVFQQHDPLAGRLQGDLVVVGHVYPRCRYPPLDADGEHGAQDRPPKTTTGDIIDAAIELFGSRGFKGTTIAAIAERVGLTDAGVLHHFPTKSVLIEAALERGLLLVDADWEASALVAYLDGIRLQWFYAYNRLSIKTAVQHYFDLLVERLAV
jgi:Bacterial regulatory proteins, tetR family